MGQVRASQQKMRAYNSVTVFFMIVFLLADINIHHAVCWGGVNRKQKELRVSMDTLLNRATSLENEMDILTERSKQHRTTRNYLNLRLRRLEIAKARAENESKKNSRALKEVESSHERDIQAIKDTMEQRMVMGKAALREEERNEAEEREKESMQTLQNRLEESFRKERLKDSEAFSLQLEEERSAHSAQIEKLYLKLKEQKTAHSTRVKKLKEGIRHAKKRIDALEKEPSLANNNNGSSVVVPDAKEESPKAVD